jgi:putative membrane protein insertion efficiency factor
VNPAQLILISAVRVYRWVLSPAKTALFGPLGRCRFTPTCSQYSLEAVREYGALRGSWLATRRICRCHPWAECGHDPVPKRECQALADGGRREGAMRAGIGSCPPNNS